MTLENVTVPLSKGFSRALVEMLEDRGIPGSMIPALLLTESSPN